MKVEKKLFTKTLIHEDGYRDEAKPRWGIISIVALIFVIALILFFNSYTIIKTGEIGILTTFGKLQNQTFDAGFHWKNPITKVIRMSVKNQKKELSMQAFSSDIQQVDIKISLNYCINGESAKKMYSTVGKEYYEVIILPKLMEDTKTVFSKYSAEDLVSNRDILSTEIFDLIQNHLSKNDIVVISVNVEDIDFTDAFTNAVEAKQVAAQQKLTAETEEAKLTMQAEEAAKRKIIEAEANAKAKVIEAEAEAEANQKISDSLNEKILSKMYYDKWNGILPNVYGATNSLIQVPMNEK